MGRFRGMWKNIPHIYGLIRAEAIKAVLPYLKAEDGSWVKNVELQYVANQ